MNTPYPEETFIIMVTGRGQPPDNVKELLPWAKKYCKANFPFDMLKSEAIDHVVKTMVTELKDQMRD